MNKWLESYPMHISIGWWVFILTGAASLLITLLTVSFQALKAAMANPIKNFADGIAGALHPVEV